MGYDEMLRRPPPPYYYCISLLLDLLYAVNHCMHLYTLNEISLIINLCIKQLRIKDVVCKL